MKKLFLSFLIALGMLLPTVNNTADAASHFAKREVVTSIQDWVYLATSGTEDGVINKIQIYRLSTGEMVRSQEFGDYSASVDLKGLPSGGYSARVICQYITVTKQFKL